MSAKGMAKQLDVIVLGNKGCGKSTLCGQILYGCGECSDKDLNKAKEAIKKFNKENCEYAFLCDKKDNERKNGTSTTNIFKFKMAKQMYTLIDSCAFSNNANRLIRFGLGQSKIAILILEAYADKNVFDSLIDNKSDIYQQLIVAHAFGLQQIVICINKIDKQNIEFNQQLYNEYCAKISQTVQSIGYNPKKVPIIPICTYSGDNLFKTSADPSLNWWQGYSIQSSSNKAKTHSITTVMKAIQYLNKKSKTLNPSKTNVPLCMSIKSRLEINNVGTVFLGRVDMGSIQIGQSVLCCKSGVNALVRKYTIKSLQTHGIDIPSGGVGAVVGFTFEENINDMNRKDQPNSNDLICSGNEFKMDLLYKNENNYCEALPSMIKYNNTFVALVVILCEEVVGKHTLKIDTNSFNINLFFRTQTLNCSLLNILAKGTKKENNLQQTVGFGELTNENEAEVVFGVKSAEFVSTYDLINSFSRFVIMNQKKVIAVGKIVGFQNRGEVNGILKDGFYKFEMAHSKKYICVKDNSKDKGVVLHQWEWLGNDNEIFYIKKQENGYYTIKCKHSGLYWDIEGGSGADHAKLIQWDYHGGSNQLFQIMHDKNGKYSIKPKHSAKSLDVSGASQNNAAQIIQYTTHNNDNQLFYCKLVTIEIAK